MLHKRVASCLLLSGCLCAAWTARADVNYGDYELAPYVGDARPFDNWDGTTPDANEGFWGGWQYLKFTMDEGIAQGSSVDDAPNAYYVTRLTQKLFKRLSDATPTVAPNKSP
jgi:hypothetical protein